MDIEALFSRLPWAIGGAIALFLTGFVKDFFSEKERKRKERITLGDKIIDRITPLTLKDTDSEAVSNSIRLLAQRVKGYDSDLGEMINNHFSSVSALNKKFKERDEQGEKLNYKELIDSIKEIAKERDKIIMRAHRLRGTISYLRIVTLTYKEFMETKILIRLNKEKTKGQRKA